jgi:hypothetical protein
LPLLLLLRKFPFRACTPIAATSAWLGAEFYLMYVTGRIFTDPALPGKNNRHDRRTDYESVVATLAPIHSVNMDDDDDFDDGGGGDLILPSTTPPPFAQRQIDRLTTVSTRQAARMNTTHCRNSIVRTCIIGFHPRPTSRNPV